MKNIATCLLLFSLAQVIPIFAQVGQQASSSEIYEALLKLNTTITVMYVAAHPDDENTRLISWLSNHKHVNTVYLSLTRGDGGQNLIGTEKGPLLGLLRTQELLQARRIDGGQQFFSRANDFGFSKTATETRVIWEEDEIIGDVVWAIRKFQPDILINRFDHKSNGKTHGHHTFSAIASMEAFDLAGKASSFPDQLKYVETWKPKRIFFNTSWWFYGGRDKFKNADKSDMVAVDVGEYFPLRGISNNEIAAQSRSMHKCQGFGSAASRGSQLEYLQFLKGEAPDKVDGQMRDMFEGMDLSWNRIDGGAVIHELLQLLLDDFDFAQPAASLDRLLELKIKMTQMKSSQLVQTKLKNLNNIIKWCSALYIEISTSEPTVAQGDSVLLTLELINRGPKEIVLNTALLFPNQETLCSPRVLSKNERFRETKKVLISNDIGYSSPYWLEKEQVNMGMYVVDDRRIIGRPESKPGVTAQFSFNMGEAEIEFVEDVQYKYVDPAIGEIYEPIIVSPPVSINFQEPVYVLSNQQPIDIKVEVRSHTTQIEGRVQLNLDDAWTITPEYHELAISQKGDKRIFSFEVKPPVNESVDQITASIIVDDRRFNQSYDIVEYGHIPKQTVFAPATAIIEHLDILVPNMLVGYISGAGDNVPQSLRQLGIAVEEIDISHTTLSDLNSYRAIVIGIRAFNTLDEITYFTDELWKYVERGGNVIVQYNTAHRLKTEIAPLPLTIGRDRITQEDAELKILHPEHQVFNFPNKINSSDFDNWVQERGLYFASEWDDQFTPLLKGHDDGESSKSGMLLVAPYGKGNYIFTGLSFFRQLPAGVPGAYRLFVNLLSVQHNRP